MPSPEQDSLQGRAIPAELREQHSVVAEGRAHGLFPYGLQAQLFYAPPSVWLI